MHETVFLFFKGIVIGLLFAIPIGPTGVLCVQRSIANGRLSGLFTGLGAATADGLFGGAAIFGLAWALRFIAVWHRPIHLIGGAVLLYLGIKQINEEPKALTTTNVTYTGLFNDYTSGLALTITNPTTLFSFLAIFAGLGIRVSNGTLISAIATLIGIALGSTLWWVILSYIADATRKHMKDRGFKIINYASVLILITFGAISLLTIRH